MTAPPTTPPDIQARIAALETGLDTLTETVNRLAARIPDNFRAWVFSPEDGAAAEHARDPDGLTGATAQVDP